MTFATCLKVVLGYEGGYSNDPADPGGPTNFGVTQKVYDAYRLTQGHALQPVKAITTAEVEAIYKRQYWDPIRGDDLPEGVNLALFDFGVNSGTGKVAKVVQKVLGLTVDGHVGEGTLAAILAADPARLVQGICEDRRAFLKGLSTFGRFGKGWMARVDHVSAAAMKMMSSPNAEHPAVAPVPGKALPPPAKPLAKSVTVWGTITAMLAGIEAYADQGVQWIMTLAASLTTDWPPVRMVLESAGANGKAMGLGALIFCGFLVMSRRAKAQLEGL